MALVGTSTTSLATVRPNQRKSERFKSNGYLFDIYIDGAALVCRYSADNGATWQTPTSGGTIVPTTAGTASAFIDADDYIHVGAGYSDGRVFYYRGIPDVARTSYTWSSLGIAATGSDAFPDVVAHAEGTSWKAHVVYSYDPGSSMARYQRVNITGAGVLSLDGSTVDIGGFYIGGSHTYPSISIDSSKNLYTNWHTGTTGAGLGIRAKKATYSAGTWTWGSEETVLSTLFANQMGPNLIDSQGRAVVAFRDSSASNYIRMFRRATDGTWSDISPTTLAGQNPTIALGSSDEVYLTYTNSGLFHRKYDGTWGSPVTADSTTTAAYPSARRDTSGNAMDVIYTTGSASPWNVNHYRFGLPGQGYHMII